jgi:dipeptidyl aminopeptidase/acylaminoacyl peptidase
MSKSVIAAFALLATLPLLSLGAAEWDNPDDIPQAQPVTVGLAGSQPADIVRFLMADGASSARLSPDGQTVAFRWAISGEPQLWTVDRNGGFPRQLTFGGGITFYEWAPDGEHLIVGRDAEGNEREGYYLLSKDGSAERLVLPLSDAFRSFGMFSSDGRQIIYSSTERNGRDFDIYVADVGSGDSRRVFKSNFGFFPSAWQPGGDIVIVSETRGEDANDVHLLDVTSGELTELFAPAVAANYDNFVWLPDGSGFYVSTNVDRDFDGLAFYSMAERSLKFIETPDHDIDNVRLGGNGRYLVWTTNEDGYSVLRGLDRESGQRLNPPALAAGVYALDVPDGADAAAVHVSGPATPGAVYVWDFASASASQPVRASLGGLDPAGFITPESLRFMSRDGVELQGLLYLPNGEAHPDKPPVVVQVHGGPTAQSRPRFRAVEQYLANNGIAVFAVNVRGSTGFGKTYARLDNQEQRLDSVRDLVDTVAYLSRDARLNTSRIAVMGGSYGGYMVNAVLGSYPGVFDAGVSIVGVSDWVRALQEASPGLKASDRIEYGDIREQRWQDFYANNSPINNADKINVPLLVSHGANDPRDPVTESDRIVSAVRAGGNEVIYMRFPDEGHSIRKRSNRVAFYRTLSKFLEQQLKPANQDVGD